MAYGRCKLTQTGTTQKDAFHCGPHKSAAPQAGGAYARRPPDRRRAHSEIPEDGEHWQCHRVGPDNQILDYAQRTPAEEVMPRGDLSHYAGRKRKTHRLSLRIPARDAQSHNKYKYNADDNHGARTHLSEARSRWHARLGGLALPFLTCSLTRRPSCCLWRPLGISLNFAAVVGRGTRVVTALGRGRVARSLCCSGCTEQANHVARSLPLALLRSANQVVFSQRAVAYHPDQFGKRQRSELRFGTLAIPLRHGQHPM